IRPRLFSFIRAVATCCKIGLMYLSGSGLNLFCFRKSYKFCSNISNTRQDFIAVGHRAKDLMLDQLVIPFSAGTATLGGHSGGRGSSTHHGSVLQHERGVFFYDLHATVALHFLTLSLQSTFLIWLKQRNVAPVSQGLAALEGCCSGAA
ncbi:mCG146071, partial [Mus musculus]